MSALTSPYVFSGERDASPWHTLERLALEVGRTLIEPREGLIQAVAIPSPVTPRTQGRLMGADVIASAARDDCSRDEYMARICRAAGLDFQAPA